MFIFHNQTAIQNFLTSESLFRSVTLSVFRTFAHALVISATFCRILRLGAADAPFTQSLIALNVRVHKAFSHKKSYAQKHETNCNN